MIEGCIQPRTRVVALITSLREVPGDVIRICSALEIFQVTGHACRTCQVVVVADVAVGTLPRWNGVGPG